ncbi:ABC transporter substrate-binding protein [Bacillus sp. FJAT-28004]|uniref:ABC transporter substrate-binding protein n=1 Tax=Bacillus sp. FJAT-28004 TaxID=1679165 RepID=UPI0006B574DD|nr:ABC transporter substrate-binding protein [Bacillus sp. FJAT-28004]
MNLRNTKTMFIAGLSFILIMLIVAGCGKQADNGPAAANSNTAQATESGEASPPASPQTKSFTDSMGTKEIPVNPQRIFSVSATTPLLALGITPVGGLKYEIEQDYYLNEYMGEIQIAGDYPPDMEAVTALEPDLIIASSFVAPEVVEQLEKIAPTVLYPWESNLYDQLRFVADIVDKNEEAEVWIKKHEEKAASNKEKMKSIVGEGETVVAIEIFKDTFQVAGNRNIGFVLHELLGLKRLPYIQEQIDKNGGYLVYTEGQSMEKLPDLTSDYLLVKVNDTQPGSQQFFEQMQKSALWKSLPAVQKGNVFIIPHDKWWSYTLFSTDALLDEAVALFQNKK